MEDNDKKYLATSLTFVLFVIMGITGIFLFFDILKEYIEDMHEIVGLVFIVVVLFHIFFNWKSMKKYFKRKVFIFSIIVGLFVVLGFTLSSNSHTDKDRYEKRDKDWDDD